MIFGFSRSTFGALLAVAAAASMFGLFGLAVGAF